MGRRIAGLVMVLALAAGCRVFDEAKLNDAGTDAGHDAGVDAGFDSGLDSGCSLRRPPPRGSAPDDGIDMGEVMFALRDIVLEQGDDWVSKGYDLDGLCSNPPDPMVECLAPAGDSVPEIDGEEGIDNAMGHTVLPLILALHPTWSGQIPLFMAQGRNALLVRVRGWNGLDDDSRVEVVMAQSFYARPGLPDGSGPIADGGPLPDGGALDAILWPLPRWDGEDWFFAAEGGFLDGREDQPLLYDDNAYVTAGTVVMRIPDRQSIIFTGERTAIVVRLTDAKITMRLSADHIDVEEAVVAGRWAIIDALSSFEHLEICRGSVDYARTQRLLELAADVRSRPGTGGPGTQCDAISTAFSLTGTRGRWGGIVPSYPLPNACVDGGVGP